MTMRRIDPSPAEVLDRTTTRRFELDGRQLTAFAGDTVGSAMAASGVVITGRSFKYHRPRGLFCMTGSCASCLCTIDGVPNVRACLEPVRDGMRVRRQNAWPSVDRDLLRTFDHGGFAMPAGFYYKIFHRPRFAWPMVEPIIRRVAGLGRVPQDRTPVHADRITLHVDTLVIGGGHAGLTAAIHAARGGKRTLLLEARHELGGHLRASMRPAQGNGALGYKLADRLAAEAREAGVDIRLATPAIGVFEGPLVAAASADALLRIRATEIVVATGAIEQPALFVNNDLPGVMLSSGVERLLNLYGILPGRRAVVVAYGQEGQDSAAALRAAGAEVQVVNPPLERVVRAVGRTHVRAAVIERRSGSHEVPCDLLVIGGLLSPSTNLVAQAGARLRFDDAAGWFVPDELPAHLSVVGRASGQFRTPAANVMPPPISAAHANGKSVEHGKEFACLCMDVTVKEMAQAVREGFDSIELLKRYTTLSMGPCQGKACLQSSVCVTAKLTGQSVAATGTPTARPPWTPVALGVLAAGHLTPRKETAVHDRHVEAGAEFMWAGDWRRPHHYQDPRAECEAVHERVALIDVSSLGKFRIKGPEAVTLLERLYPSRVADLKVSRIRYGAMLNDQGVILDDGTICRLAEDEFFVTTTTGGTGAMDQWMRWWLADWGLDVQLINVSGGYAAVNLAGPRSREVMERLCTIDVSAKSLPYLASARAELAGVPALILRIGFVGELSYEIHVPSASGEYVWDRIMEAGRDFGIAAFGLEAQRILRLEKQHVIVGQDTDALSTPYGAGLSWIVKYEKPDFLGRRSLEDVRDHGSLERLVGFTVESGETPREGAAIVDQGRPVGRVCSSRWSALQNGAVGLAWVPSAWAEDGRAIEIAYDGQRATARVALKPFYDPEGKRLRS
jgi:sarcosine oxidase, subunit alpha